MARSDRKSSDRTKKSNASRSRGTMQSGRSGQGGNSRKKTAAVGTQNAEREKDAMDLSRPQKRSREGSPSRGASARGSNRSMSRSSTSKKGTAKRQTSRGQSARGKASK